MVGAEISVPSIVIKLVPAIAAVVATAPLSPFICTGVAVAAAGYTLWYGIKQMQIKIRRDYAFEKIEHHTQYFADDASAPPDNSNVVVIGMYHPTPGPDEPKEKDKNKWWKNKRPPPVNTSGSLWTFTKEAIEEGVEYVMKNKRIHIFKKDMHNLAQLIQHYGSEEEAVRAILKELSGKLHFNESFEDVPLNIAELVVYVRGVVMDGIPKIGTLFIKAG